jgi:hypothetical protein
LAGCRACASALLAGILPTGISGFLNRLGAMSARPSWSPPQFGWRRMRGAHPAAGRVARPRERSG